MMGFFERVCHHSLYIKSPLYLYKVIIVFI
nr:MAG TPA: hypothetical protein [Caudoviricetes sp.]